MGKAPKQENAWDEPGCHDCPAAEPLGVGEHVNKPEDLVLTCTFNPPPHPRVRGHLICMHHPAKIELMDPKRYGDPVDDEDLEDLEDDEGDEDDEDLEEEEPEKYGPDEEE